MCHSQIINAFPPSSKVLEGREGWGVGQKKEKLNLRPISLFLVAQDLRDQEHFPFLIELAFLCSKEVP